MKLFGCRYILQFLIPVVVASSVLVYNSPVVASEAELAPKVKLLEKEVFRPVKNLSTPVVLSVRGGVAGISTEYYEKTIVDAINTSGIFAAIKPNENTDGNTEDSKPYALEIRIISVDAPKWGKTDRGMTVNMRVVWEFYRTANKVLLFKKTIPSTYTGGMFEGGFIGADRVRAATEGASRENIRAGLDMLAALDFTSEPSSESSEDTSKDTSKDISKDTSKDTSEPSTETSEDTSGALNN